MEFIASGDYAMRCGLNEGCKEYEISVPRTTWVLKGPIRIAQPEKQRVDVRIRPSIYGDEHFSKCRRVICLFD